MLRVSGLDWTGNGYRCTPDTLAAFRHKLLAIIPDSSRTNRDVAAVVLNDPWLLGMVHIGTTRYWRRLGRPAGVLADLRSETLCILADRCVRKRAHGFQVAQSDHASGFWTTVIRRAVSRAWRALRPRDTAGIARTENMPAPASEEGEPFNADSLLRAIFTLPPRQKAVMLLRATRGLGLHAIAEELHLSYDQVRYANLLALEQLRRLLRVTAVPA